MNFALAVLAATLTWFVVAAILFFNPVVDPLYRAQEVHPAVRALPQAPSTIAKILLAVFVQCLVWAGVYLGVREALPGETLEKGAWFGLILCLTKILPRDIDRVLLTTYPARRLGIEFVIGLLCAFVVGWTFAWLLPT